MKSLCSSRFGSIHPHYYKTVKQGGEAHVEVRSSIGSSFCWVFDNLITFLKGNNSCPSRQGGYNKGWTFCFKATKHVNLLAKETPIQAPWHISFCEEKEYHFLVHFFSVMSSQVWFGTYVVQSYTIVRVILRDWKRLWKKSIVGGYAIIAPYTRDSTTSSCYFYYNVIIISHYNLFSNIKYDEVKKLISFSYHLLFCLTESRCKGRMKHEWKKKSWQ